MEAEQLTKRQQQLFDLMVDHFVSEIRRISEKVEARPVAVRVEIRGGIVHLVGVLDHETANARFSTPFRKDSSELGTKLSPSGVGEALAGRLEVPFEDLTTS